MKRWQDSSAIAIVGHRGSGKTALACSILAEATRPVYVFDHPDTPLIESVGWLPMYRLEEMYRVSDCVVWIDEPQITIPKADKRANDGLQKLLSIARHRDITLLFSTCDTRWVTRALESYIDVWMVKDVEAALVKQGSIIKKLIKNHVFMDTDEFRLEKNEYLFYGRDFPGLDGEQTFELPVFWSERWSKPYAMKTPVKSAVKSATNGHAERELLVVKR